MAFVQILKTSFEQFVLIKQIFFTLTDSIWVFISAQQIDNEVFLAFDMNNPIN